MGKILKSTNQNELRLAATFLPHICKSIAVKATQNPVFFATCLGVIS